MDGLEYNTENIYALADNIAATLRSFENNIDSMFTTIDSTMNSPEYWQGAAYDSFKSYCDTYRTQTIQPLLDTINSWVTNVNTIAQESQANTDKNVGLFG